MDKFWYIRKQFSRANRKSLELYVTTRLWNRLDRLDVEFITQQPIRGKEGIYFTDIYFPQIKLHIEIDEGYHKNEGQVVNDKNRELDIINATNHEIIRIDATKNIEEINKRIDEIKSIVEKRIAVLKEDFIPWKDIEENKEQYIEAGSIDSREDIKFRTIVDVCNTFGGNLKGMQQAYWKHPIEEEVALWFPKLFPNGEWANKISSDEMTIYEECIKNEEKAKKAMEYNLYKLRKKRLVFAKVKGPLGDIMYRFKGLYKIDEEESLKLKCSVYRKIDDIAKTYKSSGNK